MDDRVRALAADHYRRQARTVRIAANRAQALWRQVDPGDLDGSWKGFVGPALVDAVSAGQREAAAPADAYVAAVAASDGAASDPAGRVRTSALVGQAADGRSLLSLMYQPVIETRWRTAAGQSAEDALLGSLADLLRSVETEIADAGRAADGIGIAANRTIQGYVRVVNPPACSRCIILAGKEYGWNAGFQRHPHCDCVHLPATLIAKGRGARRRGGYLDPKDYFRSLSASEQDRIFTRAGAQAIRDGASMSSVVNVRRKNAMYTADSYGHRLRATTEGTTRRGAFYREERRRAIERGLIPPSGRGFRLMTPRLLPEEIYRLAGSRAEAISMLRRYGYLT